MSLQGKTLFVTGASRGIGLAIALRAARDGANIAIAAKTAEPHKHLPGTIYSAAKEIEAAGGKALPLIVDVRDEASVYEAVEKTVAAFGGIDICVNNASAIQLTGTLQTDMKRYDLMNQVNARGTYLTSKACIPHLKNAANPHVLMLSPPLDMSPRWFEGHVAYTMAKFGMSMCVLGMASEFKADGIAFNALWPRTGIATAAIQFALAGDDGMKQCRTVEIMADAAHAIFEKPARDFTGNFLIDDSFLYAEGERDFDKYRVDPTTRLMPDFFVPADSVPPPGVVIG
ncbi:MAG: NAD(P)-dependent oxidoreductase [Phenylobacterium sp.]|uniref:SDR family oxidoreductase n=1 Tax=Phenylobacterium sp. TaxID=1871053 RepID=UPI002718AACB|nr:NAD(P)-dependent oxidoreductase [Phenylobacterium sp.]MDO8324592.1 NAD(P)-dependent oxidoreductase [Phenylobacterium sp.]MDO8912003.1 NAD(P)-dependent oxidoreductase [Phenylobacterium sp.]MDP2010610.1 NAD(P)-dependent oxidoreductase [Phenylobacterium sp.]MDP3102043.1 NAD(P)-dependent oxidoreductase [Phenylobacterium sp.]